MNTCRIIFYLFLLLSAPLSLSANQVTNFTLVNSDTDADISPLSNETVINLAHLPTRSLNIRANTSPLTVSSVSMTLSGATAVSRTESSPPYALWGDSTGNYNGGAFNTGPHTLTATATVSGFAGPPHTVGFTVIDTQSTNPQVTCPGDRHLFPPQSAVTLPCSVEDADGYVASAQWTQEAGPVNGTLDSENTTKLTASSLIPGKYLFRLTVSDNDGNTAYDDIAVNVYSSTGDPDSVIPTGELKTWHTITLSFTGPHTSETAVPNPFTDYRLNVTFIGGESTYTVPGYFAADGSAANTSADQGDVWRAHFSPDRTGTWYYVVSMRSGQNIAGSDDPDAGQAVAPLDGMIGSFTVSPTDKSGRDHRGKGRLQYVGGRYLRFAQTGEYFLKQGADAPENFLAYDDFDNTPDYGGRRKSWSAHIGDWKTTDPVWMGGKGKGIIGALNYLASEEMNAFSFLPMNIEGDDKNVFPYISDDPADRTRMDCSKLDQWEIVFEHADTLGLFLHFKTQETENELLLDGGNLGIERKIYYRELISRFSHHLALNWNLGEEINNATTSQKKSWANYFYDHDPYHHHIVIHNGSSHYDLLGPGSRLTGFSLQTGSPDFSQVHSRVKNYIDRAQAAGKPWAVACDEPGDASHALRPDHDAGNSHVDGRKNGIWGTFMAGGWGNEWYFGYQHDQSDLTCQDFRSRDNWWDYCRIGMEFFTRNSIPFWQMITNNTLSSNANDYCFYKAGEIYTIYLKDGGTTDLNLQGSPGTYSVRWYNPRTGGSLTSGSVTTVQGNRWVNLGVPPHSSGEDWAIIVRKVGMAGTPNGAVSPMMYLLLDE